MERLPDACLLHVLTFLDPLHLLEVVPLVCKRWFKLSRDPDAWRHTVLEYPAYPLMDEYREEVSFFRFVILEAPAIGFLDIKNLMIPLGLPDNLLGEWALELDLSICALMDGVKRVYSIDLGSAFLQFHEAKLLTLLDSYSPYVRHVTVHHVDDRILSFSAPILGGEVYLLDKIFAMPNLRSLSIGIEGVQAETYSDEFARSSGRLKAVTWAGAVAERQCPWSNLKETREEFKNRSGVKALIDLLHRNRSHLKVIDLPREVEPLPSVIEDVVASCTALTTLYNFPCDSIHLTHSLPHLQRLELSFDVYQKEDPVTEDSLLLVQKSFLTAPWNKHLIWLGLTCNVQGKFISEGILDSIASKCKNIREVCVTGSSWDSDPTINLMLSLPRLCSLYLIECNHVLLGMVGTLYQVSSLRSLCICAFDLSDDAASRLLATCQDMKSLNSLLSVLVHTGY